MNPEFKRMVELAGLKEISVNAPGPLSRINTLKAQIDASTDKKEKIKLAVQCVKIALYIFKEVYPKDFGPKRAIDAVELYLEKPSSETRRFLSMAEEKAHQSSWTASEDNNGAAAYVASAAAGLAALIYERADDASLIADDILKAIELHGK